MWGLPRYNSLFNITPHFPFLLLTEEEYTHRE